MHASQNKPSTPKTLKAILPSHGVRKWNFLLSLSHLFLFFVSFPCNFDKDEWFMRAHLKAMSNQFFLGGGASRHGICSWSAMSSWSSQNSISNFTLPLTATGCLYKNITTPSILHQQSHVIQRWLVKYTKYFEVEVGVFVFLSSSFFIFHVDSNRVKGKYLN